MKFKFFFNFLFYFLTIKVNESDLTGLNPSFIQSLKKEDDKYLLGCDYPTYFEIMQNC